MAGRQSYRQVGTSMRGSLAKGPPPPIQDVIAPEPVEAYPMMRPRVKVRVRAAVCPPAPHTQLAWHLVIARCWCAQVCDATSVLMLLVLWCCASASLQRAVPSIPSKFDTTLHVGQRERDAFGTRTNRFDPSAVRFRTLAVVWLPQFADTRLVSVTERPARAWQLLQADDYGSHGRHVWLGV